MAKKANKNKEKPLKVFGDLDAVLGASVKGNPKPKQKKKVKK